MLVAPWSAVDPEDPVRIGPFRVMARLGSGGMGHVFLARTATGRWAAVKTIRPEFAGDPAFRDRFAQEARAAARVNGMFTAPVLGSDPDGPVPWIATAYIAAPSLHLLTVDGGPLRTDTVLWLAAGIAEALQAIHAAGVVHRDLKPANVLLDAQGPRVIDFGLVHALGGRAATAGTTAVGTPSFMAPEQVHGRPVTAKADIYALGQTALYLATGAAAPTGQLPAELPEPLRGIVADCLRPVPHKRPTPAALIRALVDAVDLTAHADAEGWLDPRGWTLVRRFREATLPVPDAPGGAGGSPAAAAKAASTTPRPLTVSAPEPRAVRYAALRSFTHPDTAAEVTCAARHDTAVALARADRHHEARKAFRALHARTTRDFGPWHPQTVFALLGHVHMTGAMGWCGAARDQVGTAADRAARALGRTDVRTLLLRGEHTYWTGHSGDPETAAHALGLLTADCTRQYPLALAARTERALWLGVAGDPARAVRQLSHLVDECRRTLGDGSDVALYAMNAYAHWLGVSGDPQRAARLYGELLAWVVTELPTTDPYPGSIRTRWEHWRRAGVERASEVLVGE
jgi:hypothetical protein